MFFIIFFLYLDIDRQTSHTLLYFFFKNLNLCVKNIDANMQGSRFDHSTYALLNTIVSRLVFGLHLHYVGVSARKPSVLWQLHTIPVFLLHIMMYANTISVLLLNENEAYLTRAHKEEQIKHLLDSICVTNFISNQEITKSQQ